MKRLLMSSALTAALLGAAACGEPEPATPETPPAAPSPEPGPPVSAADKLTANGFGPVRVGMTEAEVTAVWGAASGHMPDFESCQILTFAQAPERVLVMFGDGKVSRVSLISGSTAETDRGLNVGDAASEVKRVYGAAVQSQPHKYQEPPAEDLYVWSGGPRSEPYVQDAAARGVRYEVGSDGNVQAIHGGGPDIQLVEGCA